VQEHRDHGLGRRGFLRAAGAGALAALAGRVVVGDHPGMTARAAEPASAPVAGSTRPATAARPNVVVILADDMGWGDVSSYDPEHSKIPTPHIDALARQGMRFTDAHTTSPVCSPSRYGVLTGRYHWRAGIRAALPKWAGPVIPPERLTVPDLLREQGYHTACVGKWHLGWEWPRTTGGEIDFTQPLGGGPLAAGFDYYYGVDVPNYPPFTFIENDRITVQPTEHSEIDKVIIANHEGPKAPGWRFDRILPTLVERSVAYVEERAAARQPFFLFLSLTSPHYPIAPSDGFKGKSGINPLADFIIETDAAVGSVADALDRAGVAGDTLLIFTTDNGHDPIPGLEPFQQAGHRVSGPFRGHKFQIAEGGHRVPFVARWPGVVAPGTTCAEPVCLTDLLATCADLTGARLPDGAGEDSTSILPLLRGQADGYEHPAIVQHSPEHAFAIRRDQWKLIWIPPKDGAPARIRLYDVVADPGESQDHAPERPEIVRDLVVLMERFIADGRSTPGDPQKNDVEVKLPEIPTQAG
jgi:arylsulfatase A-like enzyme